MEWKESDIALLKARFRMFSSAIPELQAKYSDKDIKYKAESLGLNCENWTPQDIQYLMDDYSIMGANIPPLLIKFRKRQITNKANSMYLGMDLEWTIVEDNLIRKHFPNQGEYIPELLTHRSNHAIRQRAYNINVKRLKEELPAIHHWTKKELNLLEQQYPIKNANIPELLARHSEIAIHTTARDNGITFNLNHQPPITKPSHPNSAKLTTGKETEREPK